MIIGIPKEIKDNEYRVSLTPMGVRTLKDKGFRVLIEVNAGEGSGITDKEYTKEGAEIINSAKEIYIKADIVVKVKEPLPSEYGYLKKGLILFTFLHLATKKDLARALIEKHITAIGYETVDSPEIRLPLLKPMSEVAGRLSIEIGAHFLQKPNHGKGILLGGVAGVERAGVVILGAGTVGINALKTAVGLGANVTIIDIDIEKLRDLDDLYGNKIQTLAGNPSNIEKSVINCDLLIGAIHVAGGKTPVLVKKELVGKMKKGSVIADVAVDQGGCIETIRPTTHSNPVYELSGVIHYGVANIPGAVPRTSTFALTNATLPYILKLASLGFKDAVKSDPALLAGVNIHRGKVCHKNVALSLKLPYVPLNKII